MRARVLLLGLALVGGLGAGCSREAEQRALDDLEVGRHEGAALKLEVDEGLAAVRAVEGGAVTLWGQAPAFRVRATAAAGAPAEWTWVVRNAMPDALLRATRVPGGQPLEVRALPSLRPTVKVWRVALAPGEEVLLEVAPPDAPEQAPFRFAAMADVQEALPRVEDIYRRLNEDPSLRFIYFAGDLTEGGSVEELEEFQQRLEATSRIPLFATLGNHETFARVSPLPYQRMVGRGTQHFVYRGVHFTLFDTAGGTLDMLAEQQLDGWLAEGRDAVHILAAHIAIMDPVGPRGGGLGSRAEAAALLGKLAREGVDLTLYGHVHSYYSFSNAGIPAFISGGGGAIPERFDGIGRHYLAVDVDPAQGVREVSVVRVD